MIDKSSPVPYYYQLRQVLEGQIGSGLLAQGDQLPSEAALCTDHGVSRTVVRQALSDLENEGLIVRIKGKGSFVAEPKTPEHLVQSLTSLYEDVHARGQRLETRVLRLEREPVSPVIAPILGLDETQEIVLLERLRIVDGEPWEVTTAYLPHDLCAPILEMDMKSRSLYGTLERDLGLLLHRGTRSVEAGRASKFVASQIGVAQGAPVLILRGTTYLEEGRPIEHFVGIHRGDRSRFEVELYRPFGQERQEGRLKVTVAERTAIR
jgi:GntR family transcriptional regulator